MARAPGRLDVMGGIADYSGSLVLQVIPKKSPYFGFVVLSGNCAQELISFSVEYYV